MNGRKARERREAEYLAQPYLARLREFHAKEGIRPGTFADVYVKHDDDCPLLSGKGWCACNPDVEVVYR